MSKCEPFVRRCMERASCGSETPERTVVGCTIRIRETATALSARKARLIHGAGSARKALARWAHDLRLELASPTVAKRALYVATLVLPGTFVVLPLLWWWLDGHAARARRHDPATDPVLGHAAGNQCAGI